MKTFLLLLCGALVLSCTVQDPRQYKTTLVELTKIVHQMRLVEGAWKKETHFIYKDRNNESVMLPEALDNSRVIGSLHVMYIKK